MSLQQWFDAAKTGKGKIIASNKEQYQRYNDTQFPRATALIYAVENGQENVAKLLISAERCLTNQFGWCALHCAIYNGFTPLVRLMANYEADILTSQAWRDVPAQASALQLALQTRNVEIVQILQQDEPLSAFFGQYELRGPDSIGRTSLHYLALSNEMHLSDSEFSQIASELARQCDKLGKTATMLAAECGNAAFIRRMGDANPELKMQIDAPSNEPQRGCTALMLAAAGNHLDCVQLLIPQEARMTNYCGFSAMMYAAKKGNLEVIKALRTFETGMKTTKTFGYVSSGSTALIIAKVNAYEAAVQLLMDAEKDIQDDYGRTYSTVQRQSSRMRDSIGGAESSHYASAGPALTYSQLAGSTRVDDSLSAHTDANFPRMSYVTASPYTSVQGIAQSDCRSCQTLREQLVDLKKRYNRMSQQMEDELFKENEVGFTTSLNIVISKLAMMIAKVAPQEADPTKAIVTLTELADELQNGYKFMSQSDLDTILKENKEAKQQLRAQSLQIKKLEEQMADYALDHAAADKELSQLKKADEQLNAKVLEQKATCDKLLTEKQELALDLYRICEVFHISTDVKPVDAFQLLKQEYDDLKNDQLRYQSNLQRIQDEHRERTMQLENTKDKLEHECKNMQLALEESQAALKKEQEKLEIAEQQRKQQQNEYLHYQAENIKLKEHKEKSIQRIQHYYELVTSIYNVLDVPHYDNIVDELEALKDRAQKTEDELDLQRMHNDDLNLELKQKSEKLVFLTNENTELANRIQTVYQTSQRARAQFAQFIEVMGREQSNVISVFEGGFK